MLLAIDIGNSNVVWGIFKNQTLKQDWRLTTDPAKTSEEYGAIFQSLLRASGIGPDQVTGVILSSVVPSLTPAFEQMSEALFHHKPLVVSSDLDTGLKLSYTNPRELGSDRLVNAAAAYARYKSALIIIDLGTATTFGAVTQAGEYLGGAIAPGLSIAADELYSRTAKLPKVDLVRPRRSSGRTQLAAFSQG